MLFMRGKPGRFRKRRAGTGFKRHFVIGGITLAAAGLAFYAAWYLTRLPSLTIRDITVEGGMTVSPELIREAVNEELEGNHFLFIPKRFAYAYPHKKVLESVRSVPRVSGAEVTRVSKQELHVAFTEYVPHALWCDASQASSCVFLSEDGYAFAHAPSLKGSAFVRYVTEGRAPEARTQLFDAPRMRDMEAFMKALTEELGFRSDAVTLTAAGDFEYHLAEGGMIFVSGGMSVQETFDNLHSILESEEFSHLAPGGFEYIDLRFGNRVFVKEEPDPVPTATEEASLSPEE